MLMQSSANAQEQQAAGGYNDLFVPDMVFRLSTMQQRFPSYMDPGLVDDWSREAQAVSLCWL
jgi:hypothetical protein